jgi:hypothetical protein
LWRFEFVADKRRFELLPGLNGFSEDAKCRLESRHRSLGSPLHGRLFANFLADLAFRVEGHFRTKEIKPMKLIKQLRVAGMCSMILTLALPALAQDAHQHGQAQQQKEKSAEDLSQENALVKIIRNATEQYKDVRAAEAAGYSLLFGCVSGEDSGAMGLHYVNMELVGKGELDATRPQSLIYEATPGGGRRLIGVDYLLMADAWNARRSGPPQLMGQFFHLFPSPNRFGLPTFYTLHVWAWKPNPKGTFVNWHSKVSCDSFNGA